MVSGTFCHVSIARTLTHKQTLRLFDESEVRSVMENLPVLLRDLFSCREDAYCRLLGFDVV